MDNGNENVILNMLSESKKNSTDIDTEVPSNIEFKRDENGNLITYDKETGEKVGSIYEHGNSKIAKTFSEIIRKERK